MLVLSRKLGEQIVIGGNIKITVVELGPANKVRIGIECPGSIPIRREELSPLQGPSLALSTEKSPTSTQSQSGKELDPRRELRGLAFLRALNQGDAGTLARLWQEAETDSVLATFYQFLTEEYDESSSLNATPVSDSQGHSSAIGEP